MICLLNHIELLRVEELPEFQTLNEKKIKTKSKNILKCARAHFNCARTHRV
jgi:hypothetical protein